MLPIAGADGPRISRLYLLFSPSWGLYIKMHQIAEFNSQYVTIYQIIMGQIPDTTGTLGKKGFSETERWWWLRDFRSHRGRDEKNLAWQDETGEEQDPTRRGGLRGRLQRCLIDTQSQLYCQGPSQSLGKKQSTMCTHCEQTNTPVQMHKMTGRNTHGQIFYCCHVRAISESKTGDVSITISAAGERS